MPSATTTALSLGSDYESEQAASLLEDRLRGPTPLNELVIVQAPSLTVDDPQFQAKVESIYSRITALGPETVVSGSHYYLSREELLVSADRMTTIMSFVLAGDFKEATENVEDVVHLVQEVDGTDGFRVLIGGDASVAFENNELTAEDLEKGERIGIPVALIILLTLFGSVVATLLPLGLAIVAIVLALGAVGIIGQFFELVFFVTMMITMIGLAVGIDYSLLIVSRFREELDRGLKVKDAVAKTGDTAGRTVLFSGTTVVLALIGMLIVPVSFFRSLASVPYVAGIPDHDARVKLTDYAYKLSRALIGDPLADELKYPQVRSLGVLLNFRNLGRLRRIMGKSFPKLVNNPYTHFTGLLDVSAYDEAGISYRLPDHVHAEESSFY